MKTVGRILLYLLLVALAVYVYTLNKVGDEGLGEHNYREKGYIKIKGRYFKYGVYENGEVKTIAQMLSKGCSDAQCEVENIFDYTIKLPYLESQSDRDPAAVINQNGGDCDEKVYLLVSLLRERGHESLIVFTHDHAFAVIHLPKEMGGNPLPAYLEREGKRYYYAETSAPDSVLGGYNGMGSEQIEALFDPASKRELPLENVRYFH